MVLIEYDKLERKSWVHFFEAFNIFEENALFRIKI